MPGSPKSGNVHSKQSLFQNQPGVFQAIKRTGLWSISKLCADMCEECHKVLQNINVRRVERRLFDPYLHDSFALHHLLAVTANPNVEVCFIILQYVDMIPSLDMTLNGRIREYGKRSHSTLFHLKEDTMESISTSTAYCGACLLLFA